MPLATPSAERILPLIVQRQAARTPDATFLVDQTRSHSYAAVHAEGQRWARAFLQCGVKRGDRVLVMPPVSVESVFAWLGLAWIGAVETPINYEYKGLMLDYVIADSGARMLLAHSQYLEQIGTAVDGLKSIQSIVIVGGEGRQPAWFGHVSVTTLEEFLRGGADGKAEQPLRES